MRISDWSSDVCSSDLRPPLSKEYMAGEKSFERILIRPENFWSERNVDLLLGKRVTRVDPVAHKVTLADDSEIGYGKLLWAAGGTPRMLSCPGSDAEHVFDVRRRDDVDAIMKILPDVEIRREESSVGEECVGRCESRWCRGHSKKIRPKYNE